MASDKIEKWLNSRLDKITHREFHGCVKVSKVDVSPLTDEVIVIVSDTLKASITLEMKDGTTKQLNTVAKLEPTFDVFDNAVVNLGLADIETMIYKEVLPEMEKMIMSQEEQKDGIFWAECYFCDDRKILLEDLNLSGYKLIPMRHLLDVNEAKLALKALGKYHGMGLIMKERGILDVNKIPDNFLTKNLPVMNSLYSNGVNKIASHIEKNWEPEWKNVADRLRKSVENVGERLKDLVASTLGKCNVLCHGDFTMRNMLFHYNKNEQVPDKVKLVDFQVANWSNCGIDIVQFLSSSLLPQIRERNLNVLLETYAKSLAETCKKFSYKGYVPTSSDVRKSYDSLNYFVAITTLFSVPFSATNPSEFKFDTLLKDGDSNGSSTDCDSQNSPYYQKHVIDAIKFELERCLKLNIL